LVLSQRKRDVKPFSWPCVYHGTKPHVVGSILQTGHVGMPGDMLHDGSLIVSENCATRQDACIYTSPTIGYAGMQLYAAPMEFWFEGRRFYGQVVLQCRQKLREGDANFKMQPETMGFHHPEYGTDDYGNIGKCVRPEDFVCPHKTLSQDIEWVSQYPEECIPYRVCVRVFPDGQPPDRMFGHAQVDDLRAHRYETFRSDVDRPAGEQRNNGLYFWH